MGASAPLIPFILTLSLLVKHTSSIGRRRDKGEQEPAVIKDHHKRAAHICSFGDIEQTDPVFFWSSYYVVILTTYRILL